MGHKILLADDSITVQKIVKLTFSDEGIEVVAVGNGELAVQKIEEMRPDLVMADVFMPGKDGYEVCEYVKTHPDLRQTPVILLVHAFEPFDQEHALRVGADQHLTKPFQSIRGLVATVKEILAPPASQEAYAAAASSAPTSRPAPEPNAAPLPAEPSFAAPPAETAFMAMDDAPAFNPADLGMNFPSVDPEPALLTVAPVDADTGVVAVDTAPLAFSVQADQDSGEVLDQEMNDAPQAPDLASFLPQLTVESPLTMSPDTIQPEPQAPLETEINLSVMETAEPPSTDFANPLDLNFDPEPVPVLSLDSEVDEQAVEPLACAAQVEEMSEVLDLDNELPSAPIQSDELELLPEIASALPTTSEVTATTELAVEPAEQFINEPIACEQFTEEPIITGFPSMSGDALPILAEVEMPQVTFKPEAETSPADVFTKAAAPPPPGTPEPGEVLESIFTSANNPLNGYSHDSGIGQVAEAQPVATEPPPVKQDAGMGTESTPAQGFNLHDIPPALIDEIARRVVERLSERAIQEIAWEVVPEMTELLIRQQLAEKVPH